MKETILMHIGGEWVPASDGAAIPLIDPATEEVLGAVPSATDADLDRALEAAEKGWRIWRKETAWRRSEILRRAAGIVRERADVIARDMTREQGKPLAESKAEALAAADQFDWNADEARRIYGRTIDGHSRDVRLLVLREPVGPVAAFSPWNFPALLASRKMAAALAAGCSIVVKPAEEAPRSALHLVRACQDAGLPPGVLNAVTGEPSRISERLIRSEIIRKVSFTGSVPVGRKIMALCAEGPKPLSLELGGHSPALVFEDADAERAAEACAKGKFRNNGQVCIAASRFFVRESIYGRFVERFVETARSLRLGNGLEEGVDVGPLANWRRLEAAERLLADAVGKGARVACGGRRPPAFKKGFFFEPTVLTDVNETMDIMNEEPFCPIAPIAPFKDLDDALQKANAVGYGLAGYVFSESARTIFLASEGLEAGMVGVNHLALSAAEIPFGGVKNSGFGREGGSEGILDYTTAKHVSVRL